MTKKSKKELAVLVLLLCLLSFSVLSQLTEKSMSSGIPAESPRSRPEVTLTNEVPRVDLLAHQAQELSGVKRNIFEFGRGAEPQIEQPQVLEAVPPEPVEPPLPQLHYLGFYFEKDSGLKLASISNSGKILVGKAGQVLAGRYQVLEIHDDHVILKLIRQEKVLRVPLGKQNPQILENYIANSEKE